MIRLLLLSTENLFMFNVSVLYLMKFTMSSKTNVMIHTLKKKSNFTYTDVFILNDTKAAKIQDWTFQRGHLCCWT